ncbi:MAG: glucose-6-phosphate dehydrogenase [Candidatus Magasanikbacteria bacterium]|nr:glucose-6-phosphate dehydrogenase [Candidatus Magasanikbacteria bacterium]
MKNIDSHFPTILVVFGATGDLMKKKIVPALFDLYNAGELPKLFTVIGFSRRDLTKEQFQEHITKILLGYTKLQQATPAIKAFTKLFVFYRGQFENESDYDQLATYLGHVDGEWKTCANKLFYLAVAPEFYKSIFHHLDSSELTKPCSPEEGWTRIIVEKPFGTDYATAQELDRLLGKMFKDIQIYRIDHYLAKEMIQNILTFRFSNYLFEDSWNNKSIDRIVIRTLESLGVEDRGGFYDRVGALRDVGQNHLLQILAFVTMDQPQSFTSGAIRSKRADLLRHLPTPSFDTVRSGTIRAQYDGYQKIKDVTPGSETETYFKIKTELNSERWRGVAIYLEASKRTGAMQKEIEIVFKHPEPCLCPPGAVHHQNRITFKMEPREGITIEFWSKKPGLKFETEKRTFEFSLRAEGRGAQYVEEYRKLLLDCIRGDQTLYVSTEEIKSMWRFTDAVVKAWQKKAAPLLSYAPDTAKISDTPLLETARELPREFGLIGLGKMGANMARRLAEKGWRVVVYNRTLEVAQKLGQENPNIIPVTSLLDMMRALPRLKVVWLMVPAFVPTKSGLRRGKPAGSPVDDMLFGQDGVAKHLKRGDIVIDGGNSYYKDTIVRAKKLRQKGIHYMDVGTSGGPGGARTGACLMIGGEKIQFKKIEPLLKDFARPAAYQFFPGAGAGHFVKMIHNGIEYGIMQAIAEGFAILKKSSFQLDLTRAADIYNNGSVIESRLVAWMKKAFELHGENLKDISGKVSHTGEGAWTVKTAQELGVADKIIAGALQFRKTSQKKPDYTGKIVSALREQFGGHSVKL